MHAKCNNEIVLENVIYKTYLFATWVPRYLPYGVRPSSDKTYTSHCRARRTRIYTRRDASRRPYATSRFLTELRVRYVRTREYNPVEADPALQL